MEIRLAVVAAALILVQGCATMSEDECMTGDWHAIGFEDGARGYTADRIGQYRKDCADHGVRPDLAAYRQGREEGLRDFCTPQNGYNMGSSGRSYAGVCPSDLEYDFSAAYADGRRLHDLRSRVSGADYKIASRQRQIDELETQIDANEKAIIADGTENLERARLLLETKDLIDEREDLKEQIAVLENERAVYQRDLEDYQETVAYTER